MSVIDGRLFSTFGRGILMFQVNDIVLYNQTDVCRVHEIRVMTFPGEGSSEFYMLKPLYEDSPSNSTVYVPVSADADRICRMFSADELQRMLAERSGKCVRWIENPLGRKKEYGDMLSHNHPEELLGLIRTLSLCRAEKLRTGQRFSEADEKLLQAAEKRLYPMFRYILNVDWEEFL